MPDFLLYALLTGLGVALMAGPLGCFAVWRRMAYFGDTLAHSSLMGIAFGLLLEINISVAITLGCSLLALTLVLLQQKHILATDTLLGLLSHSTLALGLIAVSLLDDVRVDLMGYLFGDILATGPTDLLTIAIALALVSTLLIWLWRPLLALTVHEELAQVEGVPVVKTRIALMLMLALVIAVAMKVVGVLLITALLIIPAAAARRLSQSPEQMAVLASGIGCLAVMVGLGASYYWDTPAGPSIVLGASSLFVLTLIRAQER